MAPLLNEEEAALDPYGVLGLESSATDNDIKKAYRKMSLKYHPDKNSTPEGAIMFRKVTVSLEILSDSAKRTYLDTRLETDRKRRERYAELDKKRKGMVDALNAREEEAKRARVDAQRRQREKNEEENIKEAGRRMLEEAQKRAAAAQAAASRTRGANGHGPAHSHGATPSAHGGAQATMPEINPLDLSLIITIPPAIPASDLQDRIAASYGPVSHYILKDPAEAVPGAAEKKKKTKGRRAIVEFAKGNWGGCWACWKDHQKEVGGAGRTTLGEGVRAKWAGGAEPAWVAWAAAQPVSSRSASTSDAGTTNGTAGMSNGHTNGHAKAAPTFGGAFTFASAPPESASPSFGSAPDFGSSSMADLLASHNRGKREEVEKKKQAEEFESMTLLKMRQMERERLEAQIRAEEDD